MSTIVKAGKVPGTIVELQLNGTGPFSVLNVMQLASQEIGRKKGLSGPAFEIRTGEYSGSSGNMIDIPQLNGRMLAEKVGDRWENIAWSTPVSDGDIVLVVPKIQGNQFTVKVARIPGSFDEVCIYEASDEEGGDDAGTVKAALNAAGIEYDEDSDNFFINGDSAEIDDDLSAGDTLTVKASRPGATVAPASESAEVETEEDDDWDGYDYEETIEVPGNNSSELREQANDFRAEAHRLETEASQATDKAEELIRKATAYESKANEIEKALKAFESSKAKLEEIGVLRPEGKGLMTDIMKLFRLK